MEKKGGKEGWDFGREEEIYGLETGGLTVFENRMIGFLRGKQLPCCTAVCTFGHISNATNTVMLQRKFLDLVQRKRATNSTV